MKKMLSILAVGLLAATPVLAQTGKTEAKATAPAATKAEVTATPAPKAKKAHKATAKAEKKEAAPAAVKAPAKK